jgi:hypothetical protein
MPVFPAWPVINPFRINNRLVQRYLDTAEVRARFPNLGSSIPFSYSQPSIRKVLGLRPTANGRNDRLTSAEVEPLNWRYPSITNSTGVNDVGSLTPKNSTQDNRVFNDLSEKAALYRSSLAHSDGR